MRAVYIFLFTVLFNQLFSQKFINGNFENNSAGSDQINLSNEALNNMLPGVTAFGSYGDVDIIQSSTYGGSGAYNGNWYIALTGGNTDIVALELTTNLVKGKKYSISFYDRQTGGYMASAIQIGVSETNTSFGTVVYTSPDVPQLNVWSKRVCSFTAPSNGKYITVQMPEGSIGNWVNIDCFNFENVQPSKIVCDSVLTITASSSQIIKGSYTSLTVTGGQNYTWLAAQGFSTQTGSVVLVSPQQTTTYTVVSKQENCPNLTATVTVDVIKPTLKKDTIITKQDTSHHTVRRFVKFTKHHLNGRKYKIQQTMNIENNTVKIQVYDKNRVDGDIVSIYLNGELIVENFQVTKEKKEFSLPLQYGSNVLVMFAINLGKIPPNTAAVAVSQGDKRAKITTLVSDFKESGALELIYTGGALSLR